MKIHDEFDQQSEAWLKARSGIPTASEFDQLVTPAFEPRKGEMPKTYLHRKLAEWWIGGPLPGGGTFYDAEQGRILEFEAKPWFTWETKLEIRNVGLLTTDDGLVGCSPDGLIGDDGGIEVKCPAPTNHVAYVLGGTVPKDYIVQVHGAMFVSGRPWWTFLSYRRHHPNLIVRVERDEKIQAALADSIGAFLENFEAAKKRYCEINGGPPPRKPEQPPAVAPDNDITP